MKYSILMVGALLVVGVGGASIVEDPAVIAQQNTLASEYGLSSSLHILDEGDKCVDSTDFAQCLRNNGISSDLIFVHNKKLNKLDANTKEDIATVLPRTKTLELEKYVVPYITQGDDAQGFVEYIKKVGETLDTICTQEGLSNCTIQGLIPASESSVQQNKSGKLLQIILTSLVVLVILFLIYQAYFSKSKKKKKK